MRAIISNVYGICLNTYQYLWCVPEYLLTLCLPLKATCARYPPQQRHLQLGLWCSVFPDSSFVLTQRKLKKHQQFNNLPPSSPEELRFWVKCCHSKVPALSTLSQKQGAPKKLASTLLFSGIPVHLWLRTAYSHRPSVRTDPPWETSLLSRGNWWRQRSLNLACPWDLLLGLSSP